MKNKQIFVLILAVFLLSFVSASYNFTNYSIQTQYATGSAISGNLKISFTNEPVNSLFTDSLGNSFSLKDLISASTGYTQTCSYPSCEPAFKENVASESFPSINLPEGESVFYGINFKDNLIGINSISFDLSSTAGESSTSQLLVDLLNDGTTEIKNQKAGTDFSDNTTFGCYVPSNETEFTLTTTPYCQEVSFEDAPGLEVGAWVKQGAVSGTMNVSMRLYDENGGYLDGCKIPEGNLSSSGGDSFCEINTPIKKGNYYLCVVGSNSQVNDYKVHGHNQNPNCGFFGYPSAGKSKSYTYEIGGRQKNFGAVGDISINNTLSDGEKFSSLVESYIIQNYGNLDCSVTNCLVPIKFTSLKNQTITLSNLNVNYNSTGGPGATLNKFSELREDPSLVNASGTLSLGQFFKLPNEAGNITYSLDYKGVRLFNKDISIKSYDISLYPTSVPVSFSTVLYVSVPSSLNSALYTWDFGDNTTQITSTPTISHAYSTEGNYTLNVVITTKIGEISKSFQITVGSAKDVLHTELQKRSDSLMQIETTLSSLSPFEKAQAQKLFDLTSLKSNLSALQDEESLASSEADYNKIISEFLSLKFPDSLQKVEISKSFLNPTQSNVDLGALNSLTGMNYENVQGTYDYITFWNVENLNSALSQNKILVNWDDGTTSSLNLYELSIIPTKAIDENYYLFIKDTGNLNFSNNLNLKEISGYKYLPLTGSRQDFSFSADETFQFASNLFISPSNVTVLDSTPVPEVQTKTWPIYVGIFVVFLFGLILYFIMHHWYKVKYEKFLFPDKNQLYNAIVYITNLVKKGTSEEEIKNNLLKAGWKREQVTYLLHKYAGKRTGMPDLFGFLKPKRIVDMSSPPKPGRNTEFKSIDDRKFNK